MIERKYSDLVDGGLHSGPEFFCFVKRNYAVAGGTALFASGIMKLSGDRQLRAQLRCNAQGKFYVSDSLGGNCCCHLGRWAFALKIIAPVSIRLQPPRGAFLLRPQDVQVGEHATGCYFH